MTSFIEKIELGERKGIIGGRAERISLAVYDKSGFRRNIRFDTCTVPCKKKKFLIQTVSDDIIGREHPAEALSFHEGDP